MTDQQHHYYPALGDIFALLQTLRANQRMMIANQRAMIGMLQTLTNMETKMAIDLTALTAEVANNSTVDGSVLALVQNLVTQISNIPPSSDPTTQAALDALVATLSANDTSIAAAVTANTPPPATPPSPSGPVTPPVASV